MPPINPRTRKFRGIIKDINSKIEESPEINETTSIRVAQDPSPSSSITGVQRKQYFRNRNSSSSSCSSRQSTRDFSPASDDDKEYKPSSLDNSSSQESDNETRTQNIKLPKKVCQQQNLVSGSQSQFSSYNSLTQKETLSSGTAPGSSSSSSSSSSSTSSTSSSSSNSSSDSEQNSVAPSKRKCVTMNQKTDIEIIISKSTEYLSSLQQIALQYDSNTISDLTPDEVCQNDSNGQTRKRKRGSKKALAKTLRNMGLKYTSSSTKHKKDRCEDCVAYENALQPDKEKLEEKYISHLKEKELSRAEKLRDKEFISENNIVACYDMQAMLQVPRGDVSSFYYKSRLNCMNFTICELKADNTDCFFLE
ncbi:uncharacterized protein LOC106143389 [Amyelois transitella]|uniref:uncharacterized protein LOC106143389 n=1 Tax=Amyelois transitella TaxID=680683 RepID=UPI0029902837|nr:uncharacterized protein LOC106143389 [Amyelois transitella]